MPFLSFVFCGHYGPAVRKPHYLTESLPGKNAELQKQIAEVEEKLKEQKKGDPRFYMLLVSGFGFLDGMGMVSGMASALLAWAVGKDIC